MCLSKYSFLAAALSLLASVTAAHAAPEESCNKFINHVDSPVEVSFDRFGNFWVPLDGRRILDIRDCRRLHFEIGTSRTSVTDYRIAMGKISGATLAQTFPGTPDARIHSMDVIGPQMTLLLEGPPDTTTTIQLWVWLTD